MCWFGGFCGSWSSWLGVRSGLAYNTEQGAEEGLGAMALIIDGYNLLYVAGIAEVGQGAGGLRHARVALLNFLAASLDPAEAARTTVVFDAQDPPYGLPKVFEHRGLTVRFAPRGEDADSLIETLIRADTAPRRLTVVSSDHRIQQAARRRRARAVDSDVWYADLLAQRRRRAAEIASHEPERPPAPLLEEDVRYWVEFFGGEPLLIRWDVKGDDIKAEDVAGAKDNPGAASPTQPNVAADKPSLDKPLFSESANQEDLVNPFPPGYAEDLLRQDEWE
jgi:predicted RNA-binding protein with PIN domain